MNSHNPVIAAPAEGDLVAINGMVWVVIEINGRTMTVVQTNRRARTGRFQSSESNEKRRAFMKARWDSGFFDHRRRSAEPPA